MRLYKAHGGECGDNKTNLLFSADDYHQTICMIIVRDMIYISWLIKNADPKVTLIYPSHAGGGVQCGCDTLACVSSFSNQ